MTRYYVDVENVDRYWTEILKNTTKDDFLLLITSPQKHILYSDLIKIFNGNNIAKINIKESYPTQKGDQSLDHALLAEINTDMYLYKDCKFIIVSNDKNYDSFINEKKSKGYHIERKELNLTQLNKENNSKEKRTSKNKDMQNIYQLVANKISYFVEQNRPSTKIPPFDYLTAAKIYVHCGCDFEKTKNSFKSQKDKNTFSTLVTKKQRIQLKNYVQNML